MTLNLKPLVGIDIATLLETFNEAFSDYIVPMQLTHKQLADKIRKENVYLEMSVGAFDNEKLIGFILHGLETRQGKTVAYNAATGVVPSARGAGLSLRLYDAIVPLLKANGVTAIYLEVITRNTPALKSYEKFGFNISRELLC